MTAIPFTQANPIVAAISALYGVATGINQFIDDLVEGIKKNPNATVRATGSVIEGAKYGFGIGYITPVAIIAVGQLILGNPLTAVWTVGSAVIGANPIAMTCGAVGAIVYGWNALSDEERNAILEKLTAAFDVGVELIRSIIQFVINGMRELLSSDSVVELKRMVAGAANAFGKSLSDITHAVKDRIFDLATSVSHGVSKAAGTVGDAVSSGAGVVAGGVSEAAAAVSRHVSEGIERIPTKFTTVPAKPKASIKDEQ
jgi:hypothetical protein